VLLQNPQRLIAALARQHNKQTPVSIWPCLSQAGNQLKGKGTQFNDYILTKSVSVEAIGCEQLGPRVVTQPRPGRGSDSRPFDRKSDDLPLHHHATLSVYSSTVFCSVYYCPVCVYLAVSVTSIEMTEWIDQRDELLSGYLHCANGKFRYFSKKDTSL